MGSGSYSAGDWAKLRTSRKIEKNSTVNQLFKSSCMKAKFNPYYINKREARDTEEHPNSTPIMIGVDVTGSMGYLSAQIIKESLNELMQEMYTKMFVTDPQLLFAAIGDANEDQAPLQVTQFESDIRIAEQLMELWLENGGGDAPEDYELLWYFASRHTDIDIFKKRKKKGFCFTIGDANCHTELTSEAIKNIFNDVSPTLKTVDIAKETMQKYHLFHIFLGNNYKQYEQILPGRFIVLNPTEIKYLPQVIVSTIQLAIGDMTKDQILDQWGPTAKEVVFNATQYLCLPKNGKITF